MRRPYRHLTRGSDPCGGRPAKPVVKRLRICANLACCGRRHPPREEPTPMPTINRIADFHAEIAAWRRDIHAHPELLYDVHRTAGTVAEKLKSFGCDEVVTGIGRTGVVGVIRGGKSGEKSGEGGRVIGLRADMDALPIQEATDVPYKSTAAGKMHA